MRDLFGAALWLLLMMLVVIFVGVPLGVFGLVHVKRKEWWMSVKRLLGGLFVAILIAFVLSSSTVQAFSMECVSGFWWICWP